MKKLIDSPATLLDTSLQGFAKAHADIVKLHTQPNFIARTTKKSIRWRSFQAVDRVMSLCTVVLWASVCWMPLVRGRYLLRQPPIK